MIIGIPMKKIIYLPKRLYRFVSPLARATIVLIFGIAFGFCVTLITLAFLIESSKLWSSIWTGSEVIHEHRLLCWVMTNPTNHWKKAQFAKRTWSKHCDIFLFMSTEEDPVLDTIALPVEEGRQHLWYKVRAAFTHIHEHYLNEADFFYKADDDTFVVPQNLRKILRSHSPSDPIWLGCRFRMPSRVEANEGYMSGGSGYVLSRESIIRMVEVGFTNPDLCSTNDVENEDIEIGRCMENINVTAIDSRDSRNRGTFMPFNPHDHLQPPDYPEYWYWLYRFYGNVNDTGDNCSTSAVSFHYIQPFEFLLYEYLVQNLTTYGIVQI